MQQRELAEKLQKAAKEAAGTIRPGMSIQAQINAACDNLGLPRGNWRVRDAWYGNGGSWQATAAFDFLERVERYKARARKEKPASQQAA